MTEKLLYNRPGSSLKDRYQASDKRLILLDYDGTLTPIVSRPEMAKPGEKALDTLALLCRDTRNTVYIISGRDSGTLDQWLGHLPVNMIAEHGAWSKTRDTTGWQANNFVNSAWMDQIRGLFEKYVNQCEGSVIEAKSFSLAWHYRNSQDPNADDFARKLIFELSGYKDQLMIDVIDGNKVVEVKNRGISKGAATRALLTIDYDFILACGDDTTDEDMFLELEGLEKAITIKVGEQATRAAYRIESSDELLSLLYSIS